VRNLETHRRAEGGSTITQQLARLTFLSRDKTYRRKLKEIILAAHIEREYSKKEILEMYLNKVYFGDGLYGAEAASRGYFGKHASELSVSEAALLAGLVKSPSSYAPTVSPARALARRNVVLQAMLDTGAIDRPTWQARRAKGLTTETPADQAPLQAALVALDPRTGHVRAMVGGRNFEDSRFNRAVQAKRQPGSAFKPFVYAAALEAGYTPATVIDRLD